MEYVNYSGDRAYREQPQDLSEFEFEEDRRSLKWLYAAVWCFAVLVILYAPSPSIPWVK